MMVKNKSRPLALLIIGLLCVCTAYAQTSITASGSGGSVTYTVGQVFFTTNSNASFSLAQGVQQRFQSVALSIELLFFEVDCQQGRVLLKWATASERNNDYFTVEASNDGSIWKEIGKVNGTGNSSQPHQYAFDYVNAQNGIVYYRLKQTDYDGKFEYAPIVASSCNSSKTIRIYPNPVSDALTLDVVQGADAPYIVLLYDAFGRLLLSQQCTGQRTQINMKDLPAATYFVRVSKSDNQDNQFFKIFKN
jgi:Secretion system C-terminal sorting domain